jgi:putative ABC transport system permease protein
MSALDRADRSPTEVAGSIDSDQEPSLMGRFAWRNLLTRPIRTILALVGLSIPVLGVLGLYAVSNSLRDLMKDTLGGIEGLVVLSENAFSPVLSNLPASLPGELRKMPTVRAVAPEVWGQAPAVEGRSLFASLVSGKQTSILDHPVILGQDIKAHRNLRSAIFPKALREHGEGRFLQPGDEGTSNIVISRKIAREHPDGQGRPRKVGDTLNIGGKPFQVVGIYETGSMLLDVAILMDIATAREVLHRPEGSLSCIYLEGDDPAKNAELVAAIEKAHPGFDARTMGETQANFGTLLGHVDAFLLMTVSLALLVGVVGIVNTMLMSTTERFGEFGVLRTNGWARGHILALVTLESAFLGLLAGLAGCLMAWSGMVVANHFITGGIHLGMSPSLWALGIGLSVATATLGGLYPAWRAARLVPMEAIRFGSR